MFVTQNDLTLKFEEVSADDLRVLADKEADSEIIQVYYRLLEQIV